MNKQLIDFYSGRAPDSQGRKIDDILAWPDERLESVHDYIQWVFPLQEASMFNPNAPLLDADDIAYFKSSAHLQDMVRRSFYRILEFYGFFMTETAGHVHVTRAGNFKFQSRNWLNFSDHNHLRITRIMKFLCLVGFRAHAEGLLRALEGVYRSYPGVISEETMRYWSDAVK